MKSRRFVLIARRVAAVAATAVIAVAGISARASQASAESPEHVAIDIGVGPYEPNGPQTQFDNFFAGDRGPVFSADATFYVYQIPWVGPLGITASGAWARYAGRACLDTACAERSDETVTYHLFPVSVMASLRLDSLQHHFHVPIFVQGDIGAEYVRFRSSRGGARDTYGGEFGLRWQAKLGLYLDALEPRAARALDENNGINHSYLFFELRGSQATGVFPVADRFTWLGGLGLVF